jgi:hypothetical protein
VPIEIALVVAGVVIAFLVFAGALAWGDMYTGGAHTGQPGE